MAWKGGSIAGEYRQADSFQQHSATSWQGSLCDCVGEVRLGDSSEPADASVPGQRRRIPLGTAVLSSCVRCLDLV